jgi:hypothetical protein
MKGEEGVAGGRRAILNRTGIGNGVERRGVIDLASHDDSGPSRCKYRARGLAFVRERERERERERARESKCACVGEYAQI